MPGFGPTSNASQQFVRDLLCCHAYQKPTLFSPLVCFADSTCTIRLTSPGRAILQGRREGPYIPVLFGCQTRRRNQRCPQARGQGADAGPSRWCPPPPYQILHCRPPSPRMYDPPEQVTPALVMRQYRCLATATRVLVHLERCFPLHVALKFFWCRICKCSL